MLKHLIKICGIREENIARETVMAGADLVGLVFHSASPRHVSLDQAIKISNVIITAGAQPVAVFVNQTDVEMRRICEVANIQIVQLHGKIARAHHHLLSEEYKRIYVQTVSASGELQIDDELRYLDRHRDVVLVDHYDPGKGELINRLNFQYNLPFKWMLAGGLSSFNVLNLINELKPNGVDVSSGVETFRGNKNSILIQQFIAKVRGPQHVT